MLTLVIPVTNDAKRDAADVQARNSTHRSVQVQAYHFYSNIRAAFMFSCDIFSHKLLLFLYFKMQKVNYTIDR